MYLVHSGDLNLALDNKEEEEEGGNNDEEKEEDSAMTAKTSKFGAFYFQPVSPARTA